MRLLRLCVAPFALVAAGCTTVSPPDNTYAFRPGTGTVQSVQEARVAMPGGTAPKTPLQEMTKPRWMDFRSKFGKRSTPRQLPTASCVATSPTK